MTASAHSWLIYGANGYTARLVARRAVERGHMPILAGRRAAAVESAAAIHGLPTRIFDLADPAQVRDALAGVAVVAHCAGPFSATSRPMLDGCLATGTHYVDITGEIAVFEAAHARDAEARTAGVVVCPGVGFDVMPTDCVAAALHEAVPGASHLALGFDTASGLSAGTAKTSVEALKIGGQILRHGRLIHAPLGSLCRTIDFGRGVKHSVAIPWGDLATARFTTGIPDIEVYVPMPRAVALALRLTDPLRPLLESEIVQRWLKAAIARRVAGPSASARVAAPTWVWGEATGPDGRSAVARVRTANAYDVTAAGVVVAVEHLLARGGGGGFFTPSQLLGPRCVEQLPGSSRIEITEGD
ncbi:MAG: saccharopine dehydrogenase NADP-binding domain-containing protein [Planctomycetia bacterium]|nr:saccharopine dehydrogenase NADP-binding domain-containing protein [Planctomycetia bacterium]